MRSITIVGGGVAGLTLGIALREQDVPVTLWEASRYPRHKVCGEFISGRGLETLARLRLRPEGAVLARSAAFYGDDTDGVQLTVNPPALCVSRYVLDEWLAREFQRRGGELRENLRWNGDFTEPGIVRATGRRAHPVADGWRWFGLKVHIDPLPMDADLEMFVGDAGYVGLCRLADRINVCGLFRSAAPVPDLRRQWRDWFLSTAGRRLAGAKFHEETFCAVAALDLEPHRADPGECALGDAVTMIAPATGNGMSLAVESAELATLPLVQFSTGQVEWGEVCREIARLSDRRFTARLRWARRLQRHLFEPSRRRRLIAFGRAWPRVADFLFKRTR